jgi:hypothetical protein
MESKHLNKSKSNYKQLISCYNIFKQSFHLYLLIMISVNNLNERVSKIDYKFLLEVHSEESGRLDLNSSISRQLLPDKDDST